MDEKHVADYFVVSGVSENPEFHTESKQLITHVLPITDITVIFRGLGEQCPDGYTCIELTPSGHVADLNNGNFKSPNIQICYRRGNDKPPLVEVGVCHEDKERVLPDVEVVYTTPYGRCASTGNNSSKSGTYLTYRRAKTRNPFNQLVVVDLCVILNNKSEHPPHAFYSIKKNLNKSYYGMIGSEVYLCYKKTLLSPPSLCYEPQIVSRFPLQDYACFPLPVTVPLFCLPTGANIELWPANSPLPKPVSSTFVLTSESAQKFYGSALSFYEPFDHSRLTSEQKKRLWKHIIQEEDDNYQYETYAIKSICLLSRWPFFQCFEDFLMFLHRLVFNPMHSKTDTTMQSHQVPLEHHVSHFLLDVSFPTPQRPSVLVQLMPGSDETLTISQPYSRLPLPLTGASFIQLLSILGVDNTMNVLLFGLSEQKILLHSLRPYVLTGVAEAISAMLFPFYWQCPYVPLCPLNLYGILNAPLPFIVGIDSRCFDTFTPPGDVICIDLDTRSIFLSELKKCLNLRILPKRAARVLRSSLEKIFQKHTRILQTLGSNQSPQHRLSSSETNRQQLEKKLELEIQEAFLRFMATILRGFRSYLLPITCAPTVGATDPTSLFDFEGFLMSRDRTYSQFYQLITRTQMFTHYIEERSFISDKDTSLAFFDDCEEKLTSSDDIFSDRPIKLFDKEDGLIQADRSVFIPAPENSPSISGNKCEIVEVGPVDRKKLRFGPLNPTLFHRHPHISSFLPIEKQSNSSAFVGNQILFDGLDIQSTISISRRTKQEVDTSKRLAKRCSDVPLEWSKYLASCCHCLWFSTLPSYITYCQSVDKFENHHSESSTKTTSRILRYAYSTLVRMQRLQFTTDEICFRVLTLLCGHYGEPALAVRVFFEMKKAGIKPNAITYGYYNKAVLESRWPDHSTRSTVVLWTRLRNVISSISEFKLNGRRRKERREMRNCVPLIGDPNFHGDVVDRASQYSRTGDLFHPTTLPINSELAESNLSLYNSRDQHRRSLINRSFSTYTKAFPEHRDSTADYDIPQHKSSIHKSFSMNLRNGSLDRDSLVKTNSSSLEYDDELSSISKTTTSPEVNMKKFNSSLDFYANLRERIQLLVDPSSDRIILENLDMIDTSSGDLFSSDHKTLKPSQRSSSRSPMPIDAELALIKTDDLFNVTSLAVQQPVTTKEGSLRTNSFGGDNQILCKLELQMHKPTISDLQGSIKQELPSTSIKTGEMSELQPGEINRCNDRMHDICSTKNVTSTPNFKLSSLINDASSLQWSRWTSSQNSKSVYKGIKSAATGLVSSLQEIKSSFSISNANTPSKLLTSAHHKSAATREMLSQWANYFTYQSTRGYDGDSDSSSSSSNDLFKLSNDEDVDRSAVDDNEFKRNRKLLEALERFYSSSNSKEDLLDHISAIDPSSQQEVAIEIKITTCSKCNVCNSLLFDEEIMERWSHHESNMNTRCVYCRAKIVPLMSIHLYDRRFNSQSKNQLESRTLRSEDNEKLLDLSSEDDESSLKNSARCESVNQNRDTSYNSDNLQIFTVPYLSPIVLRKELESVFESSGDNHLANSDFVDEHPIIFWNLLWYFTRINVPTHLALLCLGSKTIVKDREIPKKWLGTKKVLVKTLWDNEKLHSGMGKPLYRLLERGEPSTQVQAILCDDLYFSRGFLERVVIMIRSNELHKAMSMILNARLKSSHKFSFDRNRHNLYRDLIFLINKTLGPSKLSMDNFEREYKKTFENLNFHHVALNRFDRPPTVGSTFCRKCFKELSLCESPKQAN